jgi:16S rRNA (guanine966-N2)-methyltransferase
MRIIAGSAGGIPLKTPKLTTRPTADRVRESLFASLGDLLVGAKVLDLYAGSGALGIEALSRGSVSALFVEQERQACEVIQDNLNKARLEGGQIRRSRVTKFLSGHRKGGGEYNLIFADPPYVRDHEDKEELASLLGSDILPNLLGDKGVFVLETWASSELPESIAQHWEVRDERRFGETQISFLVKKPMNK